MPGDRDAPVEHPCEKAADERADDADEHVTEDAETVPEGEMAGKKSSYETDHDPEK